MRTTKNISITIAPKMLKEAEKVAGEEGRTKSELFREALRRYLWEAQYRSLQKYGRRQAKRLGIKPSDVNRLIHGYRREKRVHASHSS